MQEIHQIKNKEASEFIHGEELFFY